MPNKATPKKILKLKGKYRKIDYRKDEFLNEFKISENFFKNHIEEILNYYILDKSKLKSDDEETANYEIEYEVAPLLSCVLNQYADNGINPLNNNHRKRKNFDAKLLLDYNSSFHEKIAELPNYIKYPIMNHYFYKANLELQEYIPVLLEKLICVFNIIIHESYMTSGSIILDLIKVLDNFSINYLKASLYKNNNENYLHNLENALKDELGNTYMTSEKKYSLDYLISQSFNYLLSKDIDELNPKIDFNFKESLNDNTKNTAPEDIENLRNEYCEQLNLSFYGDRIENKFSNYANTLKSRASKYSSKLDYLLNNKDQYLHAYKEYIRSLSATDPNLDYNIPHLYELDLIKLKPYITKYNLSKDEQTLIEISYQMYDEVVHVHTEMEKLKNEISNNEFSKLIESSFNNALGQILYELLQNKK